MLQKNTYSDHFRIDIFAEGPEPLRIDHFLEIARRLTNSISVERAGPLGKQLLTSPIGNFPFDDQSKEAINEISSFLESVADEFLTLECARSSTIDVCFTDARDTEQIRPVLQKAKARVVKRKAQSLLRGYKTESASVSPQSWRMADSKSSSHWTSLLSGIFEHNKPDLNYGSSSVLISSERGGEGSGGNEGINFIKILMEIEVTRDELSVQQICIDLRARGVTLQAANQKWMPLRYT